MKVGSAFWVWQCDVKWSLFAKKNPRELEKERKEEKTFFFTSTSVEVYNRFHYTRKNAVLYLHISVKKDLWRRGTFKMPAKESKCFTCEFMIFIHFAKQQKWPIECFTYNFNFYLPELFHHIFLLVEKERINGMSVGSFRHQIFIINNSGTI